MNNQVNLIIEFKTSTDEIISLNFQTSNQKQIDLETLNYPSSDNFLMMNQEKIKKKLHSVSNRQDLMFHQMYILKGKECLKPLFQNMIHIDHHYQKCIIPLAVIIKSLLRQPNTSLLFKLDKNAKNTKGYQSIFTKCSKETLEALELGIINESILNDIWEAIKENPVP